MLQLSGVGISGIECTCDDPKLVIYNERLCGVSGYR